MMSFWQAVALGGLQGITEFLPVSSSGHLVLLRGILEVGEVPLLFDVLLHSSTLAATAVVFRARLGRLIAAGVDLLRPPARRRCSPDDRRLLLLLVLCTAVTGAIGMALGSVGLPREPGFVSFMLLVTAAVLLAAPLVRGTAGPRAEAAPSAAWQPRWPWALLIGVVQGLAVIPGISRSGATIAAGVLAGADRETAADFSFLALGARHPGRGGGIAARPVRPGGDRPTCTGHGRRHGGFVRRRLAGADRAAAHRAPRPVASVRLLSDTGGDHRA